MVALVAARDKALEESESLQKLEILKELPKKYGIDDNFVWMETSYRGEYFLTCTLKSSDDAPQGTPTYTGVLASYYSNSEKLKFSASLLGSSPEIFFGWDAKIPIYVFNSRIQEFDRYYRRMKVLLKKNGIPTSKRNVSKFLTIMSLLKEGYAAKVYKERIPKKIFELIKLQLPPELILMILRAEVSLADAESYLDVPPQYVAEMLKGELKELYPRLNHGKTDDAPKWN